MAGTGPGDGGWGGTSFRSGVGEDRRVGEAKAGCGGDSSVTIVMRRRERHQGVGKGAVGHREPKGGTRGPGKREQQLRSREPGGCFPEGSRR